ncbi:MAG: hypothetical protein KIS94_14665 [Chitinophagales bacterium]|nr:hypothetical protein [Chitinophagales bacterium]
MKETFEFTPAIKKALFWMMGAGLIGLLFVFLMYPENKHARFWSNITLNVYYFTGIGLFGLFVVAATQLAYGGWQTLMKRIFLSLSAFAAIGGFLLLGILLLGFGHVHSLYDHVMHILHEGAGNPKFTTKLIYFAPAFWIGRLVAYALLWFGFSKVMNNFFARTDQTDPKVYKRSKLLAAAFIVVFALTESAVSWDMIMSMDPHWYSTLFGWYNFASYGCAAWAMTILIVIFLKSQGYLEKVNENHVHDLGKMLFGFSIFWTYLWFDQFMLQWYANIPEDTNFWVKRFDVGYFKFTVFLSLLINFVFPLLVLIKRGAKRNFRLIGFGAALLIFGHYVDFFNYTFFEPNNNEQATHHGSEHAAVKSTEEVVLYADASHGGEHGTTDATAAKHETTAGHSADAHAAGGHHAEEAPKNFAAIGLGELLIFIGFLGVFLYMFFNNLAKRPIVPENDPYLKESEKLTVIYS